jgi:hypothetical protein
MLLVFSGKRKNSFEWYDVGEVKLRRGAPFISARIKSSGA